VFFLRLAAEPFRVTGIRTGADGTEIVFDPSAGRYNVLERAPACTGSWGTAAVGPETNAPARLTDPQPPAAACFYRVVGVAPGEARDSDGDGMDDVFELRWPFLNPLDPFDAGLDPDWDGYTNLDEYRLGSDPSDPHSPDSRGGFRITALRVGPATAEVDFVSSPANYYVLRSGDSASHALRPEAMAFGAPSSTTLLAPRSAMRFFRVQAVTTNTPFDTDGDGMDDVYELQRPCLQPLQPDGDEDADGDGIPNFYEYAYGTDPASAVSVPTPARYVDAAAPPGGDGSLAWPHATLGEALQATQPFDIIRVADGVYSGPLNRDLHGRGLPFLLLSAGGSGRCVIDCEWQGRAFLFDRGEDTRTALRGLTIRNGYAPTGSGLALDGASPLVSACRIENCLSDDAGGAVYARESRAIFRDCALRTNSAWRGGGAACDAGSPRFLRCTAEGNAAAAGGGLAWQAGTPDLRECLFRANQAHSGGGLYGESGAAGFSRCRIEDNAAEQAGGGGCVVSGSPAFESCLFARNRALQGGGLCSAGAAPRLANCTVAGNRAAVGGGLCQTVAESSPTVCNTIVWGNGPDPIAGGMPAVSFSDVEGGFPPPAGAGLSLVGTGAAVRIESICLAAEIGATGAVTALELDVREAPAGVLSNFTIRLKTAPSAVLPTEWESNGWTVVYRGDPAIAATGRFVFAFDRPFASRSNLLVAFSHQGGGETGGIAAAAMPGGVRSQAAVAAAGDPLDWSGSTPAPVLDGRVPAMRLRLNDSWRSAGPADPHNLAADPLLADTFRLRPASPCIDAGTAAGAPVSDRDGEARWDHPGRQNVASPVDIGADEYVDADADGMADAWEIERFGSTTRDGTGDAEGDGLDDRSEHALGTDPFVSDTDGDGLTDGEEVHVRGTDPLIADTDGDGVRDGDEVAAGTDPARAAGDTDGDGLNDDAEAFAGSCPTNAASYPLRLDLFANADGDGLPDWWEVHRFGGLTEHERTDFDDDGADNGTEFRLSLNPCDAGDADADGMPDDWERAALAGTAQDGPEDDPDGDGLSNLGEQRSGLNPLSIDSDGDGYPDGHLPLPSGGNAFPLSWPLCGPVSISNRLDGTFAATNVGLWREAGSVFRLSGAAGTPADWCAGHLVRINASGEALRNDSLVARPAADITAFLPEGPARVRFGVSSDSANRPSGVLGGLFLTTNTRLDLWLPGVPEANEETVLLPAGDTSAAVRVFACLSRDCLQGIVTLQRASARINVWSGGGSQPLLVGAVSSRTWDLAQPAQRQAFRALQEDLWVQGVSTGAVALTFSHSASPDATDRIVFQVVALQAEASRIRFNHDAASSDADALTIRKDRAGAYDPGAPEWVAGGINLPVCYAAGTPACVQARFTVRPAGVTSAVIRAAALVPGGALGDILPATVRFTNGVSCPEYVTLPLARPLPDAVGRAADSWRWRIGRINGASTPEVGMNTSGVHVVYTVLRAAAAPWSVVPGDARNAWTSVLDRACVWAAGARDDRQVVERLTPHAYAGFGKRYDGSQSHTYDNVCWLSDLLADCVVDCRDMSAVVQIFTAALGSGGVCIRRVDGPFSVPRVRPIGLAVWTTDRWNFHQFAWHESAVCDACVEVNETAPYVPTHDDLNGNYRGRICQEGDWLPRDPFTITEFE
jgi:hypothetical protein